MTSRNELSRSIHSALGNMPQRRQSTAQDIAQEAQEAKESVETNMGCIAEVDIPSDSDRHLVTFQLLRASMDYGRAFLHLLETYPIDMAAVALGMHRSQNELFLRAVFVQFIADEEQLQDFLKEDRGPRRRNEKGNWKPILLKDLASEVESTINRIVQDGGPQKLARTISNSWKPLCGLVHGGRAILAMYRDDHGRIGPHVPAGILFEFTANAVVMTVLCVIMALSARAVGAFEESELIGKANTGMVRYIQQRATRMATLDLSLMSLMVQGALSPVGSPWPPRTALERVDRTLGPND